MEGKVLYNQVSGKEIDLNLLREKIGFVTQDTQLFSGTIRENLLFVKPGASDEDCMRVLHQAGMPKLIGKSRTRFRYRNWRRWR
jgi:ATP-binding cassette subfamily B protein